MQMKTSLLQDKLFLSLVDTLDFGWLTCFLRSQCLCIKLDYPFIHLWLTLALEYFVGLYISESTLIPVPSDTKNCKTSRYL